LMHLRACPQPAGAERADHLFDFGLFDMRTAVDEKLLAHGGSAIERQISCDCSFRRDHSDVVYAEAETRCELVSRQPRKNGPTKPALNSAMETSAPGYQPVPRALAIALPTQPSTL